MSGRPCVSVSRGSTREVVELNADALTIGRVLCDFIIDNPRISRRHLRLKLQGETVFACDESANGTMLNGIRMVRGEAVALKEGDELRIVFKEDMLPKPPQAICAEECKKLKVVFVFHMDADEARRHVAQATAQATAAAGTPAATAAAAASSAPAYEQEQQTDKAAEAAAEQAEVVQVSTRSARPACVSRPCSAALSPPPAARAPFTVLSPQQAGAPPSPPPPSPRVNAEEAKEDVEEDADEAWRRVAQATAAAAAPAAAAAAAASSDKAAPAKQAASPARGRTPFSVLTSQQAGAPPSPPQASPSAQDESMPDYVDPLPVESIHGRDDDVDDDDDDSEGEGLGRGAAARRDLGLSCSDEGEDEDEYEVELIVQARGRGSGRRYRVRWQGFTEDHDTWEPAEHLHPQLIAEFESEELAEEGGDKAAAAGDEAAEHLGGYGGLGGRGRGGRGQGGRGRSGRHGRGGSSGAQQQQRRSAAKQHVLPKKPRLTSPTARLLASFRVERTGNPDGISVDQCKQTLALIRAQSADHGSESSGALASYHKEAYPTPENESYTALVGVVGDLVEGRGANDLRVGISAAADGELGKLLAETYPDLIVHQSDLRPGQAPDVYGIDADAHPLNADGVRIADGGADVALARNCFYDMQTTFLTLQSMCRVLCLNGVMAVACIRKQLGNVSAFLLEAERLGVLTVTDFAPIRLVASRDKGAFDGYKIVAIRTGVPSGDLRGLPILLGSTCRAPGIGGAQLAKTMLAGLTVAIEREAVETRTGALPYRCARLEHAYMSVAAGEAVLRWSGILTNTDAAVLYSAAMDINASGARLTLAAMHLGLRTELGLLDKYLTLNTTRLTAAQAAGDDKTKLAALRKEPGPPHEWFAKPVDELVGVHGSTPCIYLAYDVNKEGYKIGDACNGVHIRYGPDSDVKSIPLLRTPTSLSGPTSGGKPDLSGFRSCARESIETLVAASIGGGLGKASSMFGSLATLGAKPGRTSTSLKPGFVGATPAQLKVILKPGLVGATPAQLKGIFKPGSVGATPAQLALKGAQRSSRLSTGYRLSKGQLEAATPAQLKQQKRKEREAASNLSCTRCNFKFRSLNGLKRHQSSAHPYCVPGCLRHRRDDRSLMIGCDACDGWYHPDCLGVVPPDAEVDDDTPWVCPACSGGG